MSYTDVFGNATVVPSKLGYQALSISADTTALWPYDSAGGTTVSKIIDISATTGGLSFSFPDARDVSNGEDVLVRNVGANTVTFKDASGATIGTVTAGAAKYFFVTDNSTAAGAWASVAYGVGSTTTDAASLIGYGIIASGSSLNQAHPITTQASGFTATAAYRATLQNYTGGTGTVALTVAATLGDNFFFLLRNSGTGVLTIDPSGSEQIDGASSLALQPGESAFIACSGAAFYTVGLGRSLTYNFTQLVKDVSAAGSFTLSAAEASNKLIKFTGNPSAAVTIVVPNTVAVYYTLSALSTSQTITMKTAAGTGTDLSNGSRAILICDGSEVYSAQTADISTLVSLPDGSAAAPALNFSSTTTTGIYKYSTSGFGMAVAGVERWTDNGTTSTIGTLTGIIKRASGVESAAVAGTDYCAATSGSAILKANGSGGTTAASGTDVTTLIGSNAVTNATNATNATTATAANAGPSNSAFSHRNKIINGDMRIAQRALNSTTQGYTVVDRFYWNRAGGVSGATAAQVYGAFGSVRYCLSLQRDVGNANTASMVLYQPIEGVNCRDLAGKSATVSFLIGTGADVATSGHSVRLFYQTTTTDIGVSGSWTTIASNAFTVTADTSFTRKSATFNVPSNATQLELEVTLAVTGTAGADDRFYITDVQLEEGSLATPFENRPIGTELALCRRYYRESRTIGGTFATGQDADFDIWFNASDFYDYGGKSLRGEPMRVPPTMQVYDCVSGTSGNVRNLSGAANIAANISNIGTSAYRVNTSAGTANHAAGWHWTASAEL